MAVITISRETGSEGDKLGMELADALGYAFVDKEIIRQVAEKIGASPEQVERYDEKAEGPLARFLSKLFRSHPEVVPYYGTFPQSEPAFAYGVSVPYLYYEAPGEEFKAVNPDEIVKHFETMIREMAAAGNVIIVGRASQCILESFPSAVHIRTVAPLQWRVEKLMAANPDVSDEDARDLVERNDSWRKNYICANYHADWDDPELYHLTVSMDRWDRVKLVSVLKYAV